MSTLLLAEHDNAVLKDGTHKALTAAAGLGAPVTVLVIGQGCGGVAAEAAKLAGVAKVLVADDALYAQRMAEPTAALVAGLAGAHSAVIAPSTTTWKNVMPRVAALLDVMQVSDVVKVHSADTFDRPIYAGNAIQTVTSRDAKKVITVRTASFAVSITATGLDVPL